MNIWIYITWFAIIVLEILRNWAIIVVKHRRPKYWWSNVIRIMVGFIFWVITGVVAKPSPAHYYALPIMMALTFWWTFDYGLNLVRKVKPYYYLNPQGSWLDQWQCNHPNTYAWFWFKLFLAFGGVALVELGLEAVIRYQG